MALITWPTSLPQNLLVEGYSETFANNLSTSDFDFGSSQTRRRSTGAPVNLVGNIRLTHDEALIFEEFFNITLAGGSQRFRWKNPISETFVMMQFNPETQPVLTAIGGEYFNAALTLFVYKDAPIPDS